MAIRRHINPFSKVNNDTGFGNNASSFGGRFINRDGTFNLRKEGMPFWERFSIFHRMLSMPRWKFIAIILIFYFAINLVFAIIYWLIGADQLQGVMATTPWASFKELYFSAPKPSPPSGTVESTR